MHLTAERVVAILELNRITAEDLEHATHCADCNAWLLAFVAVAMAGGKKIAFPLPPVLKTESSS